MKIERVELEPVCYRLRKPVRTHRAELRERRGWRVRLSGPDSRLGLGEALPLPEFGSEPPHECLRALESLAARLHARAGTLEQLLDLVDQACPDAPAACCAFDGALHDLAARVEGIALARLLGAEAPVAVHVNALIAAVGVEESVAEARAAQARGFHTLKLKVGSSGPSQDETRLRAVRDALGGAPRLRIDANGAWDADAAIAFLERVAPLEIELVEQPVPARDLAGLARVHHEAPVAVAADETLVSSEGREAVLEEDVAAFAVLKPMLLGGLRSCQRFARAASTRGVRCFVTTSFESWIGTAQAAHLAAAIQLGSRACGLASCDLLEAAFPPELIPVEGQILIHDRPGLGCVEPA